MGDWRPPHWLDVLTGLSWRLIAVVVASSIVLGAITGLSVIVMPMVLALFLAAVLSPISQWLRNHGFRPAPAALVCLLLVFVAVGIFLWLVMRAVIGPWDTVQAQISNGIDLVESRLADLTDGGSPATTDTVRSALGGAVGFLLAGALRLLSVTVALASTLLLSMLVLFFYLKDGDLLWTWVARSSGHHEDLVDRIGRAMWVKLEAFVRGTAMVAMVDGIGIALGAFVIGVPSVAAIGVITFVLAFIPYFGAIVAGAIACMIALSHGGFGSALAMLVVVLIVQQVESNVLQPLVVGRAVRLHPLVVALGVIAGGAVGGVLGMFLAIPVIAASVAGLAEMKASGVFGRRTALVPTTSTADLAGDIDDSGAIAPDDKEATP